MKAIEIITSPKTGKPLKKSQLRVLATVDRLGYIIPGNGEVRTNPYSGAACLLCPLAVALYDFITTQNYCCGRDYTRTDWDNARYLFLELWPDEYYKLID